MGVTAALEDEQPPPPDPLDALAAAHGAKVQPTATAKPAEKDQLDELAAAHGAHPAEPEQKVPPAGDQPPPGTTRVPQTFVIVNGKRVPIEEGDDDEGVSALARHFGQQVNPVPLGQVIPFPKAAGGAGMDAPVQVARGFAEKQQDLVAKAKEAMSKGDYVTAGEKALTWALNYPTLGMANNLDKAGVELQHGKYMAAGGDVLGLITAVFGPKLASKITIPRMTVTKPAMVNPNVAEAAAAEFGQAHDIPVDAGTITGNRFVKSAQALADHSPIGSVVAERAKAGTGAALERVGGELADAVHPDAVTPEQAGTAMREGVSNLVGALHGQANDAYGRLRAIEMDPANTEEVPITTRPTAAQLKAQAAAREKAFDTLGRVPTDEELHELRRIRAEMENLPFVKHTWNDLSGETGVKGNAGGGHLQIVGGAAGAPVYQDILAASEGKSKPSRSEVLKAIRGAIDTGNYNNHTARAAMDVIAGRLKGDATLSKPSLPPEAGAMPPATKMVPMAMPVDLREFKAAMKPIYRDLMRAAAITPPTGDKGRALAALDRIVRGPDFVRVSTADAALSDLKASARGAVMPELRTRGQGIAAKAVRELEQQVSRSITKAGPDAIDAITEGRAATKAKYVAADILDAIREEPVRAFKQATAPKDTAIALLRKVQEQSPMAIPMIGRAVLEDMLHTATESGGFKHAAKLYADWRRMGPETKQMLFGENQANIGKFLLLATKLEESPNPSQSGLIVSSAGQIGVAIAHPLIGAPVILGSGALSKMLHSPAGARALTRAFSLSVGPFSLGPKAATVAQTAAASGVLRAARRLGIPLPVPGAAGQSTPPTPQTKTRSPQ